MAPIDDGRPGRDGIAKTLRNLREVSPTWYFNVPLGYQFLLDKMDRDADPADKFFARLQRAEASGSASRVVAVALLMEPLDFDKGEVTDKGSVNQRAVLRERADAVADLYGDHQTVIHGPDRS